MSSDERRNRLHVAALDAAVGRSHRPRQPIDLHMDVALGRIEATLGNDAGDVAPTVRSLTISSLATSA